MFRHAVALGAALLASTTLIAADTPAKCSLTQKCPKESPCCSQYGECGVGAYCLGGCDPRMSFSLEACLPSPVCVSKEYKMDSLDGIVDVSKYLGDASKADWVAQGSPLEYNGNVLLTMAPKTSGTVLSSTHYMWYGDIEITLKTSRGAGVVSAFILFSDVKDEIDYEWVGVDLKTAQTNYYFQGIPDYTHSGNLTIPSDSYENFHTYKVSWTPDEIKWIVDGDESKARTMQKSKTWNSTMNRWDFPQTPARIQISLWPGGREDNAKGTIDWAGGVIDWNGQDIKDHGYYYATLGKVTMKCWESNTAPGTHKNKGYYYNDMKATNDTVVDGTRSTIIKSLIATGLDAEKDYPSVAGTASQSVQQVIPGLVGGGAGTNGQAPPPDDSTSSGSGSGSGSSGSSGSGSGSGSSGCSGNGFQQSCGGSTNNSKNDGVRKERAFGASAFAALIAVAGMMWL